MNECTIHNDFIHNDFIGNDFRDECIIDNDFRDDVSRCL